tara:strand:+ start:9498 stop:10475 length:978 start_codon:yes stop_codon:yes gene_type:complete
MTLNNSLINKFRNETPVFKVVIKRGSNIESIHNVHAVVCDKKHRVLMSAGSQEYETFIRSSLKPFQSLPFISSGTAEQINSSNKGLAIACASHIGSTKHAREAFRILWNADIDVDQLKCPIPRNKKSKLEHNCSGKHAAFLATCKKMDWPLNDYLSINHPLQIEIIRRIAEFLNITPNNICTAVDDCGSPTLFLKLNQISALYAELSQANQPELIQVTRAMIGNPELIGGLGQFDTELMNRSHGQVISKGGSEGLQCLGRIGEGMGVAIKVEDGSKRAKHAVALNILRQLEWITPTAADELEQTIFSFSKWVQLEVIGELKFKGG